MSNPNPRHSMKFPWIIAAILLAAGGTWYFTHRHSIPKVQPQKITYTCPMHHQIRRDEPGTCPICGMTLVPLEEETDLTPTPGGAGTDAMNPGFKSVHPGKSPAGTDWVPVDGEDPAAGKVLSVPGMIPVKLSAYKQQLAGVRLAEAKVEPLTRVIRTVGRFAGGGGDFAALAGEFAARNTLKSSLRYVVADVYALDLPFLRLGQKAYVTSLSGDGPRVEGKVTLVYPYDGTQSRVTRVRISLPGGDARELFANVEIEAATGLKLAIPPSAVMDTGTRRYVFVQSVPGTFIPRAITVGYEGDDGWEVLSGLKGGDKVVDGANFLVDADSKIQAAFADSN